MSNAELVPFEEEGDFSDLPDLTEGQHKFMMGMLEPGKSASQAFMEAYDCSAWTQGAIWTQASRMKSNPKIVLWLDRIKAMHAHQGAYTVQDHLEELDREKSWLRSIGNGGAVIRSIELKGKAAGHYVERVEVKNVENDAQEIINECLDAFGDEFKETEDYKRLVARL